jgi:hypothetical protein
LSNRIGEDRVVNGQGEITKNETGVYTALYREVKKETDRAIGIENGLRTDLDTEEDERKDADESLSKRIGYSAKDSENGEASGVYIYIDDEIAEERKRAEEIEE